MANTLFPATEESTLYSRTADDILTEMAAKGNKVAGIRRKDLDALRELLNELSKQAESNGLQALSLTTPEMADLDPRQHLQTHLLQSTDVQQQDRQTAFSTVPDFNPLFPLSGDMFSPTPLQMEPLNNEFLDNIGISSYELFSLVEQMGNPNAAFTQP